MEGLSKEYGDWHVIYVRVNSWAKKGVLQAVFLRLQQFGIIRIQVLVPHDLNPALLLHRRHGGCEDNIVALHRQIITVLAPDGAGRIDRGNFVANLDRRRGT